MNFIFTLIFILSAIILSFTTPETLLPTMLSASEKALTLTLKLAVIYAVWLGIFEIFEKTGVTNKLAKGLKPFNKLLFGKLTEKENEYISLNISANILGMSGATTPMGIKSIAELEKRKNTRYAIEMFFIINATSVQLIPTSVMALRTSLGSKNSSDIIIPTLITTLISSVVGILLAKVFLSRRVNE